jgi:hypothetical protein
MARCTRCNFMWYSLSMTCGRSVLSTIKTDRHDIAEILLKVVLNTITPNTTLFYFYIEMADYHIIQECSSFFLCKGVCLQCGFKWREGLGYFARPLSSAGIIWGEGLGYFARPLSSAGFSWREGLGYFTRPLSSAGFRWREGLGYFARPLSIAGFRWREGLGYFARPLSSAGLRTNEALC